MARHQRHDAETDRRRTVRQGLEGARTPSVRQARRLDIDWARGLAVLVMIHAHVLDAWTHPGERATLTFRYLNVLAGFAAPLFLWLSGLSLMLSAERLAERQLRRRDVCQALVSRGLEIFIVAHAFRAVMFIFNPGGSLISVFRVDVLNVMGPALAVVGLIWGAGDRLLRVTVLVALTAGVGLLTPVVQLAQWVDAIPVWLQWYVRPAGEHTVFTVFPWTGFVFAGGAAGALLSGVSGLDSERRLHRAFAVCGVCLMAIGLYTSTLPSIYRESSFWSSSPTFFAIRVGLLLILGAGLHLLARAGASGGLTLAPLQRLGKASLFVYVVHIPVVYGWLAEPLRRRLSVWQTVLAFAAFSAATYALVVLRDSGQAAWLSRTPRSDERLFEAQ